MGNPAAGGDGGGVKQPDAAVDARYEWLKERVCSSLRVKEEQFQRLLQGEARRVVGARGVAMSERVLAPATPQIHHQPHTPLAHTRPAFVSFLEDESTRRLLVYVDGKDLGAVSVCACRRRQGAVCVFGVRESKARAQSPSALPSQQATKPPTKSKKKTVFFVKPAGARLDGDNIKAQVRRDGGEVVGAR